jgi:dephospho-CoA kinase
MTSDKRTVIALVGRKGSGKGTVAKILKERYGASVYRYSDVLRDVLMRLSIDLNRENLIGLSEALRKQFGEGTIKHALMVAAMKDPAELLVLDGLRRLGDLEHLDELGTVHLVNVAAPLEVRYKRLTQRGENAGETSRTFESFAEMEHAPTEVTIGDLEAKAELTIENIGNAEELSEKVNEMMKQFQA